MAKQIGSLIKEARMNAGLTQKALAEKAGCVTAADISKAERDIKELTPEQLGEVANVLGVTPESLTDAPPALTDDEKEWLKLYKSADADTQNAAAAVLKGETAQNPDPMAGLMGMLGGMMGGGDAGGENAGNSMAGLMEMLGGMMGGGQKKEASEAAPEAVPEEAPETAPETE